MEILTAKLTRRKLLKDGTAALLGTMLPMGASADKREDGFTFLHVTDLHASETTVGALKMPNKFEGKCFIDDINALEPRPAFVLITGDLISETSPDPATWPRAERYWTRYRRIITDRLRIPFWQILGNNDCAAEPYKKVYPELPTHWTFTRGGVCFVGLHGYSLWKKENTNHAGILYNPEQLNWLEKTILDATARTLVLVTHEPLWGPDTHRARRQLAPLLRKFHGEEIWNIAGHEHANELVTFHIGGTRVQGAQTTTPIGVWKPDKGAYRIFSVSDGRITASTLRWLTKDGDPISFEPQANIRPTRAKRLIEERLAEGARTVFLVGEEDVPLRQSFTSIEDRLSNLRLHRKGACAIYRIPLEGSGAKHLRLAANIPTPDALALSADGQTWQTPQIQCTNGFTTVPVPAGWRTLHVRLGHLPYANGLYGFALV